MATPPPAITKRIDEVAAILATGVFRLARRASEQQHCSRAEKVELDFTAEQSVCPTVSKKDGQA